VLEKLEPLRKESTIILRDLLDIAAKHISLPPLDTAATDHDFAIYVSSRPCGDKVADLAKRV
jgi:hypothetical protein